MLEPKENKSNRSSGMEALHELSQQYSNFSDFSEDLRKLSYYKSSHNKIKEWLTRLARTANIAHSAFEIREVEILELEELISKGMKFRTTLYHEPNAGSLEQMVCYVNSLHKRILKPIIKAFEHTELETPCGQLPPQMIKSLEDKMYAFFRLEKTSDKKELMKSRIDKLSEKTLDKFKETLDELEELTD